MKNTRFALIDTIWLGLILAGLTSCSTPRTPTPDFALTATSEQATQTFLCCTATPEPAVNSEIVLYRGDAQRRGVYDQPAIRILPEVKWQSKAGYSLLTPPLVAQGILYTVSLTGSLYALDVETGQEIWTAEGLGQLESTGAIAGKTIVSGGIRKLVRALDRNNGEELWSFATDHLIQGAPLIVGDRVYIATDHAVYALGLQSGQLVWETATGSEDAFMGAPAYENGVIYTTGGKILVALDAETGNELWRVEKEEQFLGLAVANQLVYVGNWDRYLYAFDQSTGEERWKFQADGEFWSAPAATEDVVYAGNGDQKAYALDAHTGQLLWSFETAGRSVSDPLVSDGVVYVSDSAHEFPRGPRHLYALDAATGEQLWVFETTSTYLSAPALGNGVIYIVTAGEAFALKSPGN